MTGKRKAYDTPNSPTVDIVEELLPSKYHARSTTTMAIASGAQQKPFELTSK